EVEDVADVDAVPRDLDAAEGVDREVAERVRLRRERREQGDGEDTDEDRHAPHASLRATGAQISEKRGLSASARWNQARASREWPRHRSIIPRWKNLSGSCVPSLSAWRE